MEGGASTQLPKRNVKSIYFKIPTQQLVLGNFKLNLLVKKIWVCNWCNYGQSQDFSVFFNNLIPLPFVIEFKICKVGRMHSYEYDGELKTKKKGGWTFGLGMKEKISDQSCMYIHANKFQLFLSILHLPSPYSIP
jgi:hypothetical protein